MKKLLMILLISVLLLPVVVKADIEIINTYCNHNVTVGGEVEVHIPVSFGKEYNLVLTYDGSLLEISSDDITISQTERNKVVDGKSQKVQNLLETKVEKGKVTIKARMDESEEVVTYQGTPEITLKFTAVKEGSTKISIDGGIENRFERIPEVKITKNDCPTNEENNCEVEAKIEQEPDETEEDSKSEPVINDNTETAKEEKTETKDNNILLYCSLGLNALLLVAVIVVAVKKKAKAV